MDRRSVAARLSTVRMTVAGSLALLRGGVAQSTLEDEIRRKYSEAVEIDAARRHTAEGLTEGERALLQRHLAPGARVLDVGCAAGRVTLALHRAGFRVVGADVNEAMIRTAAALGRAAGLGPPLHVMDARHLGFRDRSFEAVLMIGSVICYVRPRWARVQMLREVRRVLRPGGRFFVVTPSRECSWKFRVWFSAMRIAHATFRLMGRGQGWEVGDRVGPAWSGDTSRLIYWYMYSPAELEADLAAAGLRVVAAYPDAYMMSYVASRD